MHIMPLPWARLRPVSLSPECSRWMEMDLRVGLPESRSTRNKKINYTTLFFRFAEEPEYNLWSFALTFFGLSSEPNVLHPRMPLAVSPLAGASYSQFLDIFVTFIFRFSLTFLDLERSLPLQFNSSAGIIPQLRWHSASSNDRREQVGKVRVSSRIVLFPQRGREDIIPQIWMCFNF